MKIATLDIEPGDIRVTFDTGDSLTVPLDFFPELAAASHVHRTHWTLIGRGIGVHWKALDLDISIENFLAAHSRAQLIH
jgi:hypothetical protein